MQTQVRATDPYIVPGLVRGLEILRCFDGENSWLSQADIANRVDAPRSSVFRLLYTLEQCGYLVREDETKRYRLASRVLELGYRTLSVVGAPALVQPHLERLRDETGGSTHLAVLEGMEVRYLARVPSRQPLATTIAVGSTLPADITAMGKAILAWLPVEVVRQLIREAPANRGNGRAGIDEEGLLRQLPQVRSKGYAVSNEEYKEGIGCVAVAVFDGGETPFGAINVSGPAASFGGRHAARVASAVKATASEISELLAWNQG